MLPEFTRLTGQYNLLAVALSILVATLGSYVGLDLAAQAKASKGRARRAWLTFSTLAMSIAIWSMHYSGMLAFHLPVPVRYHVPTTFLSFCIAVVGSALGLYIATSESFSWRLATIAAFFNGAGIVGLHYTSMASMRAAAIHRYSSLSIVISAALSAGASLSALRVTFGLCENTWALTRSKAASALIMGAGAIAGMHYAAMAGTDFFAVAPHGSHGFLLHTVDISPLGVVGIIVVTVMVLAFMLFTAVMVQRLEHAAELERVNEALKSEISERQRAEAELGRLSGQLLRVQDQERRKIARDLHDSTAQRLVLVSAALKGLQDSIPLRSHKSRRLFSEAEELVAQALRELRTLSYLLHPPMLDESGLEDAISHYVEGYALRSGVQVDVQVSADFGRLGRDREMALFRVLQESLTNVQLHSGSRRAYIRLHRMRDRVILEIRDEGRGTAPTAETRRKVLPGVGIPSMRERVKQIGGQLHIDATGTGTTVRVTIGMDEPPHEAVTHSGG